VFYLVNKVGSVLENDDQLGLAHFMEHMTFKGSKHFPKNSLVDELQTAGLRFGADINAYTGYDETVYQLPLPTDKPDLVLNGLQIMRDWAQEATLDPKEIDKERGVVLEEKRLGKGAGERMQRQYYPMLLNHSRYAERNPKGSEQKATVMLVYSGLFEDSPRNRIRFDALQETLNIRLIVKG
jgi:zinc protease